MSTYSELIFVLPLLSMILYGFEKLTYRSLGAVLGILASIVFIVSGLGVLVNILLLLIHSWNLDNFLKGVER